MTRTALFASLGATLLLADPAAAQVDLTWYTIDGGGGISSGGTFFLAATIGQSDAGSMSGGPLALSGGFWVGAGAPPCYANCDGSTGQPALTANDFQCFVNSFAGGAGYANCDGSTGSPTLTANDFQCFLNRFAQGCT